MNHNTITVRAADAASDFEIYTFGVSGSKPAITFTAGIHGDEMTGMYVAKQLTERFIAEPPHKGCVKIIPVANATALNCMQRRSPFDGRDLNRIFPGDASGSLSYRLADAVYRATDDADVIVDLHCCLQHSEPHILSVYSEAERIRRLAESITLPIALHSEGLGGQLFTEACRRRSQAACIIELPSGHGSGSVNMEAAERCLNALEDMLKTFGVREGAVRGRKPSFYGKAT